MTAAYRLRGVGWFGGCTAVVLGFYLVSLQVAAERKKLEHLDAAIASTQRDIRALETEFDTRANLAQLERWNGDTLALSAPQAGQFVRDAGQLASIDVARAPDMPGVRTAALVVPSLAPAPLRAVAPVRMATMPVVAPAMMPGARGSAPHVRVAFASMPPVVARSPAVVRIAATAPRAPLFLRVAAQADAADRPAIRPAVALRAHPQIALLDRKLLSDSTLGDLASGARVEGGRLR